jgi:hypothetical protein
VASIRLYNQTDEQSGYRVRIAEDPTGRANALRDRLLATLHLDDSPWTTFSQATATTIAQRHSILPTIINNGIRLAS